MSSGVLTCARPQQILPEFAAVGGFDKPILHGNDLPHTAASDSLAVTDRLRIVWTGLCSMGISGKHVLKAFGEYKDIKVR